MKLLRAILCTLHMFSLACGEEPNAYERLVHCDSNERTLLIDSSFDDDRVMAFIAVANDWSEATKNVFTFHAELTNEVEDSFDECTITIINRVPKETDDNRIGETYRINDSLNPGSSIIYIANNVQLTSPDGPHESAMQRWEFEIIAKHEIGHALGLPHMLTFDHVSIMETNWKEDMTIGSEEIDLFCAGWQCPTNLTAIH